MSAFVVEDDVIVKIVSWLSHEIRKDNGYYIDRMLKDEGYDLSTEQGRRRLAVRMFALNVRAVDERYGRGEAKKFRPLDFKYRTAVPQSDIATFKALGCWNYQCSEGNVPETRLYKLMERVENMLARHIVYRLPEYEQAPWG